MFKNLKDFKMIIFIINQMLLLHLIKFLCCVLTHHQRCKSKPLISRMARGGCKSTKDGVFQLKADDNNCKGDSTLDQLSISEYDGLFRITYEIR